MVKGLYACILLHLPLAAAASAVHTDFIAGTGTDDWQMSPLESRSPSYEQPIDGVSVSFAATNATGELYALSPQGDEVRIASLTAASSGVTFAFSDAVDYRAFRLTCSGGWTWTHFTAYPACMSLPQPAGISVTNNVTGTSFSASWQDVEGALGYRVSVWTNVTEGACPGNDVWRESFAAAPASASTRNFQEAYADHAGWTGEKAYASLSNGAVRIGNTSAQGVLVSPVLPESAGAGRAVRICAWRQSPDDGTQMPVSYMAQGNMHPLGCIDLSDTCQTFYLPVPDQAVLSRIVLHSPTNRASARVLVDEVALVSGYAAGTSVPRYLVEARDVGLQSHCHLEDLPSESVFFSVCAYTRRQVVSPWAAPVAVDLAHPLPVEKLQALSLADLPGEGYAQSFDALAALTAQTGKKAWLNGTTLPGWQAWENDQPVVRFDYNAGKATVAGLYALADDRDADVRALGALTRQGTTYSWGLALTNDSPNVALVSEISFVAEQWGFANTDVQDFACSFCVSDHLAWMPEIASAWQTCWTMQTYVTDGEEEVSVPKRTRTRHVFDTPVRIQPGEVLYVRWTLQPPEKGSSAMVAIDDFSLCATHEWPTLIRLVSVGAR